MALTYKQEKQIRLLRECNLGYRVIAAQLSLSRDTVRNFCTAHHLSRVCGGCGNQGCHQLQILWRGACSAARGRKRKFCSDACCRKWWSNNPQAIRQNPEALYEATCLNCGKAFTAYGNNHRRYCSHACYIQHRFGSCASQ